MKQPAMPVTADINLLQDHLLLFSIVTLVLGKFTLSWML